MTPEDIHYIIQLLGEQSGQKFAPYQVTLIENRLNTLIRKNNFTNIEGLIHKIKTGDDVLKKAVGEAMAMSSSAFINGEKVGRTFAANMAYFRNPPKYKIMSAGSAGGQEAVSFALLLSEYAPGTPFEINGIDISRDIVTKARRSTYSHFEVQKGLPIRYLLKYFTKKGKSWVLCKNISEKITYSVRNLLVPLRDKDYDVIICRRILELMSEDARKKIIENLTLSLKPKGLLIVGDSETLGGNKDFIPFPFIPNCYMKKG